jgi:hypothetical protein
LYVILECLHLESEQGKIKTLLVALIDKVNGKDIVIEKITKEEAHEKRKHEK